MVPTPCSWLDARDFSLIPPPTPDRPPLYCTQWCVRCSVVSAEAVGEVRNGRAPPCRASNRFRPGPDRLAGDGVASRRNDARGQLRAQLRQQQVVLISDPAGDQEGIDEHPEEGDQHAHDRQRQNELRDRDAGALEIEIVGSEQPQEKPQYIGDERGLLVGLGMGVFRSFNWLEWQTISHGTVDAQKLSGALANPGGPSLSSDRLGPAGGLANGRAGHCG
jgi:hypothetical protein